MRRQEAETQQPRAENAARVVSDCFMQVVGVYEMHIAINGIDIVVELRHHLLNDRVGRKKIVGIEDAHNVARSHANTFVHRVVDAVVFLGNPSHPTFKTLLVRLDDIHRIVRRVSIDNNVFNMAITLSEHRIHRVGEGFSTISGNSYNRYFQHFCQKKTVSGGKGTIFL